jgi:hypothetical protein
MRWFAFACLLGVLHWMQSQVEANFGQQCSQASAAQIWRWTQQALVLQGSVGAAACENKGVGNIIHSYKGRPISP